MDFSASQRSAHAEEFADAVIEITPGFQALTKASQEIERNAYLKEAREAEVGCEVHFRRSAKRLKTNGSLIPREHIETFNDLLHTLLSQHSSRQDFDDAINTLRSTFPKINGWLSWWLRPAFASMIFPACSFVDPAVAEQVPSTSNPAKHQHSLLHHAVGVDQDLIPGTKKLFLHVSEVESQYRAIKGE
jgi:inorganic triphosphatase YgiF